MEESFDAVIGATPSQLNGRLWINFVGEKAYNYGGLSRLNLRYFTCCVCNSDSPIIGLAIGIGPITA